MEVLGLTVREISLLYSLPHPLSVLEQPCLKNRTRNSPSILLLVSGKGNSAAPLTSLVFFKPQYHSLVTHMDPRSQPTWGLQGSYSAENVEWQILDCSAHKHWSANKTGCCPVPGCPETETLQHLFLDCTHYNETRVILRRLWENSSNSSLLVIFLGIWNRTQVQLILDASVNSKVILLVQT